MPDLGSRRLQLKGVHVAGATRPTPRGRRHRRVQFQQTVIVASGYPESFTEVDVDARGAYLANLITELWPGPDETSTPPEYVASPVPQLSLNGTPHASISTCSVLKSRNDSRTAPQRTEHQRNLNPPRLRSRSLVGRSGRRREARRLNTHRIPTPADAIFMRDKRNLRWERVVARLYGDARRTDAAKRLYE